MLIILISYLIGIICGLYVKNIVRFCLIDLFLFILLYLFYDFYRDYLVRFNIKIPDGINVICKNNNRIIKTVLIFIFTLIMTIGFICSYKSQKYYDSLNDDTEIECYYKVLEQEEIKNVNSKYNCYIARDLKTRYKVKLVVNKERNKNIECGDVLRVCGIFTLASGSKNEGEFNYREYLKTKKIVGFIKVEIVKEIIHSRIFDLDSLVFKIRKYCGLKIEQLYDKECSDFLKGLLIGITNNISNEIKDDFRNASLSSILAISGMHVSYVVLLLDKLIDKTGIHKCFKNSIICVLLLLFMFITGFSASCIRACLMQILLLLSFVLRRKNDSSNSLFFSLLIVLMINPYNVKSTGMWLSYVGTFGIIKFGKSFENYTFTKIHFISQTIKTSLAVQVSIFPLMWCFFGIVSLNFMISFLLSCFFIGIIIMMGYISIVFPPIAAINNVFTKVFLIIVKYCSKIPCGIINVTKIPLIFVFVYYFILFLIYKRKINKKNVKYVITIFLIIIVITQVNFKFDKSLELYFLDVGQGDCTVLRTPQNKVIVVDSGEGTYDVNYDYGKSTVFPFLMYKKMHIIDYLIVSHGDLDHIGGCFYLLNNMKVKNIVIGRQSSDFENIKKLKEIAKSKKINIIELEFDDILKIDKSTTIVTIWPNIDDIISDNEINNMSLVFSFESNGKKILFTGDIEKAAEDKIVSLYRNTDRLNADILKVAHHGSKTSSTNEFIEMVSPDICLIGVGKNNKFGHPNSEVLELLESYAKIYRTDLLGEVKLIVK